MNRREFLKVAGAAGAAGFLGLGCVGSRRRENAALRATLRKYVDGGLFNCIVCMSNRGDAEAYGNRTLTPSDGPATLESLFDLASIGKTQTAAMCALLHLDGKLDLDAPFTEYLPEHVLARENCKITIRDLATHSGGFSNAKPYQTPDVEKMFREFYRKRPEWPRGQRFCYACSNYAYLGFIIEKLTGLDLDAAARKMIWGPLGMSRTTWNPIVGNPDAVEYAYSTYDGVGGKRRIGDHNGVCSLWAPRPVGNGSCFSSAPDMMKFLDDLRLRAHFPAKYYDLAFAPSFDGDGHRRSFGWDMRAKSSTFTSWTPTGFSDRAICHSGWTGPVVAVDPASDFAGVVLTSRVASKEKTMGPRLQLLEIMRSE